MSTRNFSNKPNLQDNIQNSDYQVNVKKNIYKPVFGNNNGTSGSLTISAAIVDTGITTTTTTLSTSTGRGSQGPIGPAGSQGFQGFQGQGFQGPAGGGSGGSLISKTFNQLTSMVSGGTLVAGQQYLMTDYQTVYLQPNTNILKTDATIEPLILTAISGGTFSTSVKSTIYPNDEIEYDITNTSVGQSTRNGWITWRKDDRNNTCYYDSRSVMCNVLQTAGTYSIYFGNSGEDFSAFSNLQIGVYAIDRGQIAGNIMVSSDTIDYSRYEAPFIVAFNGYNNTDTIINVLVTDTNGSNVYQIGTMSDTNYYQSKEIAYPAVGNVSVQAFINNQPSPPTLPDKSTDTYYDILTFADSDSCFSNTIEKDINNNYTDSINNNSIRNSSNITFGPGCVNNVVGDGCYGITFEGQNIGNDVCGTDFIGGSCFGNIFRTQASFNAVGSGANSNDISGVYNKLIDNANANVLSNDCEYNFIAYGAFNNTLIDSSYNSLVNDVYDNEINESYYNFFGYGAYSNRLFSSSYNHLDDNANYCDFAQSCSNNFVTGGSARIKLGESCSYNYFGSDADYCEFSANSNYNYVNGGSTRIKLGFNCSNNTFDQSSGNNELGDGSSNNIFNPNSTGNKFGLNCINNNFDQSGGKNNTLSDYCQGNTIGGDFNFFDQNSSNNILHGTGSDYNKFGQGCTNNELFYSARNTFGNNCSGNTLDGGDNQDNFFGDNSSNNYMNASSGNRFGNGCSGNSLDGGENQNNFFGDNCSNNTINNGSGNKFGNNCSGNIFYSGGNNNNIFDDNCSNNAFYSSYSNKFGQDSSNNTNLSMPMVDNVFASSFYNNTFGVSGSGGYISNNVIGNGFTNNQFQGGPMSGNVIKDNFSGNTINMTQSFGDPQSFNYNYIEDNVSGITYPSSYNNKGPWLSQPITFNDLQSLVADNLISVGKNYLIVDYSCVYTDPVSSTVKQGPIEPLIVVGGTASSISRNATSTIYPNDYIEYNLSGGSLDGININGVISRRIDDSKNDAPYDIRAVKFTISGEEVAPFGNGGNYGNIIRSDSYNSNFPIVTFQGGNDNNIVSQNANNIFFGGGSSNNYIGNNTTGVTFSGGNNYNTIENSCNNISVQGGSQYNKVSGQCSDLYINGDENIFNKSASNIVLQNSGNNGNIFGESSNNITLNSGCVNNSFSPSAANISIGNGCNINRFDSGTHDITTLDGFTNNKLENTYSNTYGNNCVNNYVIDENGNDRGDAYSNNKPWSPANTYTLHANPINYNEVAFYFENSGNITDVVLAGATASQIKTGQDSTYTGLAPTFPYAYTAGDRIFITFTYLNLGQPNANIDVFCKDN